MRVPRSHRVIFVVNLQIFSKELRNEFVGKRVDRANVGVYVCVYTSVASQIALTYWRPQVWSKLLAGLASILRRLFYTSNIPPALASAS